MRSDMRAAVLAFLSSLSRQQRAAATFDFGDDERFDWQYTPGPRGGLALAEMDSRQRASALSLLDTGLSARGAATARSIRDLEPVLKALEEETGRPSSGLRDPGHYWFSVFGDPATGQPWAWRVGGHHLCLHFTQVGEETAVTPLFFGANPARVPSGPDAGVRVLAAEEDLARELLASLSEDERAKAVVSSTPPDDIVTTNSVRAELSAVPSGIAYADLGGAPRRCFDALLEQYLGRVVSPGLVVREHLTFAWAGATAVGEGHYYAIRGAELLVEYDNTQNGANHVHTVWRDTRRDWGQDLLAAHYRQSH